MSIEDYRELAIKNLKKLQDEKAIKTIFFISDNLLRDTSVKQTEVND